MSSWRINVVEDDQSRVVLPSTGEVGACVIKSKKGKEKPTKFYKGQESRILELLGYPSSTYPDVWDVIQFSKQSDIWVSAPNLTGIYGGVLVTKTGSIPLTVGLADRDLIDFEAIEYRQQIGVGDGLTLNFLDTLELLPYVHQSIDILVNGTSINVTASNAEPEILTTVPGVGSGTLTRATGALSFTFLAAPAEGDVIEATFQSDQSALAYFALFAASPCADGELGVMVSRNTVTGFFQIKTYTKNNRSIWREVATYIVSEVAGTFDGFGANIFIENILNEDHDYLYAQVNSLVFSTFADDAARVDLGGGSRGGSLTITEYTAGWDYFKSKGSYPADIFMDFSALPGIPALFDTLRTTYQQYKSYLLPLPMANDSTAAIATKNGFSINNRGLAFYWNWRKARDSYNSTAGWWTSRISKVGVKFAQMQDVFNGLAPAWVDENNHGGQLGSGTIESYFEDVAESELEALDEAGINPIIADPQYGDMIVSQRTAKSPASISDASWIGHSRVFDYIILNILQKVMVFQICKLNDEVHRQMASSLGQSILDPVISAGILAQGRIKCDSENNDSTVLAQRKFVYQVFVKVTPFSEEIEFIFTNVGQNVDIEELV